MGTLPNSPLRGQMGSDLAPVSENASVTLNEV
jgi:hypothetical protein